MPDDELTAGAALSIHRIVQESVSNVLRHAPGAPIEIAVRYAEEPPGLVIHVRNGPAVDAVPATRPDGSGHGLLGMRKRVAMLDGRLAVGATPDGGYAVAATLPAARTAAVPR